MKYLDIDVGRDEGVTTITLNRPGKLNAYTPDMGDELVHALRAAASADNVRALVITGAGSAFCAGADLQYLQGKTSRSGKHLGEEEFIASFTEEFTALPVLTVVAINGIAAGIGITGMLAADIRVAAADANLVLNFAELGIMPGMGSTYFLPRLVGESTARELLLSRRRLSGAEAARIGLVNHAVAATDVLVLAQDIARGASGCKAGMVDLIKRGLSAGGGTSLAQALATEKRLSTEVRR